MYSNSYDTCLQYINKVQEDYMLDICVSTGDFDAYMKMLKWHKHIERKEAERNVEVPLKYDFSFINTRRRSTTF